MGSIASEEHTFNKLHGVSNVHALQTRSKQNSYNLPILCPANVKRPRAYSQDTMFLPRSYVFLSLEHTEHMEVSYNAGYLKYPQIIQNWTILVLKPMVLGTPGTPHFWNPNIIGSSRVCGQLVRLHHVASKPLLKHLS